VTTNAPIEERKPMTPYDWDQRLQARGWRPVYAPEPMAGRIRHLQIAAVVLVLASLLALCLALAGFALAVLMVLTEGAL
jgi:hypothetical protein